MKISVIICCYNSATRLPDTLKYVALQQVPPEFMWEVVLVDNNSSDATAIISAELWSALGAPVNLIVVQEAQPGLSYARRTGISASKGEVIVFCDDDNLLSTNYIMGCYNALTQRKEIGVMCGASIMRNDIELPIWFTTYQVNYAVGVFGLESQDVTHKGWIWGAGMAFRRELYDELVEAGFKNALIGRKKEELSSGEDVEFCKWIILVGHMLWYESTISLVHKIPKERLNVDYVKKFHAEYCKVKETFALYDFLISLRRRRFGLIRGIIPVLKGFFKIIVGRRTYIDIFYIENFLWHLGLRSLQTNQFEIRRAVERFEHNRKLSQLSY